MTMAVQLFEYLFMCAARIGITDQKYAPHLLKYEVVFTQ